MSLFLTEELPCPDCGTPVSFELVHSVNADRRPDLRVAILDRSFQREPCPACGHTFRVEPELTYIDVGRGQWIAAWPASKQADWKALEQASQAAFDKAFGADAPGPARALGASLRPRMVFGWPALAEKLIAADAGIDDVTLELVKAGILRSSDELPVGDGGELRLLGVEEDTLVMGRIDARTEDLRYVLRLPSAATAEIEADAAGWAPLRGDLSAGLFQDLNRALA